MWLLFTAIWVVVAALNVVTILAFSDGAEREKAWVPVAAAILVPASVYFLAWLWTRWRGRGD
jgi:hypothetical protein